MQSDLETLPAAPDYLTGSGLAFYEVHGKSLLSESRLNGRNLPLFLDACFYIMQQDLYKKRIIKARNLSDHKTYRKLLDDANRNLRLILVEFGLTPGSAARVPQPKKESKLLKWMEERRAK